MNKTLDQLCEYTFPLHTKKSTLRTQSLYPFLSFPSTLKPKVLKYTFLSTSSCSRYLSSEILITLKLLSFIILVYFIKLKQILKTDYLLNTSLFTCITSWGRVKLDDNKEKLTFLYWFLERGEGREKVRERNINVWLSLECPPLGTWPATQACALPGNWTCDLWFTGWRSIHWATPARVWLTFYQKGKQKILLIMTIDFSYL